jgi:hypothetical protein
VRLGRLDDEPRARSLRFMLRFSGVEGWRGWGRPHERPGLGPEEIKG